jgi:hypothetical protein
LASCPDDRDDRPEKSKHLRHAPGRNHAYGQHDQRAGESGPRQGQRQHDRDHHGVVERAVAACASDPEQHGQANQADQSEVGKNSLQQLGEEDGAMRDGRRQEEVHIARQVERLQQHAKTGKQDPDERTAENQGGQVIQEGTEVPAQAGEFR